jgi:predicted molibdopterin-dependent oxidoreductase YjgC
VGVQLASLADDGRSSFSVTYREAAVSEAQGDYSMTLLTPVRAYDSGEWMRESKLLKRAVPAHAIISMADAQRLGVGIGEVVRVTSVAGSLDLPAMIDAGLAEGLVLVPAVRGADLSGIATGTATRISLSKV